MQLSDLSVASKTSAILALLGFVVSFSTTSSTTINGVETCEFIDYGALLFGGLAVMIGGLGEVRAMTGPGHRILNFAVSGGAGLIGLFHVLRGIGMIGGPCG